MKVNRIAALSVMILLLPMFISCNRIPPENLEKPDHPCVMEYRISDEEYIHILYINELGYVGEWKTKDRTIPILLNGITIPSTAGPVDYWIDINEITFPIITKTTEYQKYGTTEYDHMTQYRIPTAEKPLATFQKGMMNSENLILPDGSKLPITLTLNDDIDIRFDWMSQEWDKFSESGSGIYREEELSFWYDSTKDYGEWETNGSIVPIRMEFAKYCESIIIYDISGNDDKLLLEANGRLTDDNTFVSDNLTGTMFYGETVNSIKIHKYAQ